VQERLGHAKVSTTLEIYSHVVPSLQEAAALRFEEGLIDIEPPKAAIQSVSQ
jgi:integrase